MKEIGERNSFFLIHETHLCACLFYKGMAYTSMKIAFSVMKASGKKAKNMVFMFYRDANFILLLFVHQTKTHAHYALRLNKSFLRSW